MPVCSTGRYLSPGSPHSARRSDLLLFKAGARSQALLVVELGVEGADFGMQPPSFGPPSVKEVDRYFTADSDPSQEEAVIEARQTPDLVISSKALPEPAVQLLGVQRPSGRSRRHQLAAAASRTECGHDCRACTRVLQRYFAHDLESERFRNLPPIVNGRWISLDAPKAASRSWHE